MANNTQETMTYQQRYREKKQRKVPIKRKTVLQRKQRKATKNGS